MDDISAAAVANQTATLGIFDERKVGGVDLKALPIGAANPDSLSTARFNLDAAAANRALHIQITPDMPRRNRRAARAGFPAPQVPVLREIGSNLPLARKH